MSTQKYIEKFDKLFKTVNDVVKGDANTVVVTPSGGSIDSMRKSSANSINVTLDPNTHYTKAEIDAGAAMTGILKVDGAGSGLDAATINGSEIEDMRNKRNVTYLSKSGFNSQAMLVNGKLYTTSGTTASYGA